MTIASLTRRRRFSQTSRRCGFSLLELILSISLTLVVITILGMAIQTQLRATNVRQTRVEQAQLARSVLRKIAEDIEGALPVNALDFNALVGLDPSAAEDALDSLGDLTGTDDTDMGTGTEILPTDAEAASSAQDIASAVEPPSVPGLYGNQYELQIDVSRLPRADEYDPYRAADGTARGDRFPSDLRTIAYYLGPDPATAAGTFPGVDALAADTGITGTASAGLIRRTLDRAVTLQLEETGDTTTLQQQAELIAPEVVQLEFRYWDGSVWLTEWNSDIQGGLPLAVEISIAVVDLATSQASGGLFGISGIGEIGTAATDTGATPTIHRLVVKIPAAKLIAETPSATIGAEPADSSSNSPSGSGSGSGSGAGSGSGSGSGSG